jgi:hypothetical protein
MYAVYAACGKYWREALLSAALALIAMVIAAPIWL